MSPSLTLREKVSVVAAAAAILVFTAIAVFLILGDDKVVEQKEQRVEEVREAVDGIRGKQGQRGRQGRQGSVNPETIRASIELFCSSNDDPCKGIGGLRGERGERGSGGSDGESITGAEGLVGRSPTEAEVDASVRRYCSSRNNCRGPTGSTGSQGPGPTSSDLDSAVARYCGRPDQPCRQEPQPTPEPTQ